MEGNDGHDLAAGDCVSVLFYDNFYISRITSTYEDVGKDDKMIMGEGDDVAIGGEFQHTLSIHNTQLSQFLVKLTTGRFSHVQVKEMILCMAMAALISFVGTMSKSSFTLQR